MTIGGLPSRFWGSITTILSIALVVATLLAFLAMSAGFAKTVAGTGSDDIAMILGTGSEAELNSTMSSEAVRLLEESPGFARDASGRPITSPELYVVVGANRRAGGGEANVSLRGVTPRAPDLRPGFRFSSGRMFEPGTNEMIVGAGVVREFKGFDLNSELQLGGSSWTVVGVFEVPGTVFDSELWADLPVVQSLFNRGPSVQALRARLESPASLAEVKAFVASEPRLQVDVKTEKEHFAGEAQSLQYLIYFGWALSITLGFGALAGALNTMYAAVEARSKELATLRAIGGFPAFMGAITESLVLALSGGLVGAGAAYLLFNGLTASTLGGGFTQVVFDFNVGPAQIVAGVQLAALLGLVGGIFPALRAARTPLLKLGAD
ncbi:MAG: ABC transporter permease [Hyphomonadaceae bacterium]|nr:ABC transporter permease [Hyphomonadaceae bacterium]